MSDKGATRSGEKEDETATVAEATVGKHHAKGNGDDDMTNDHVRVEGKGGKACSEWRGQGREKKAKIMSTTEVADATAMSWADGRGYDVNTALLSSPMFSTSSSRTATPSPVEVGGWLVCGCLLEQAHGL